MSGVWGKNIKYSIFGESHGIGIGIIIDGLPTGIKLDFDMIETEMTRRRPGRTNIATSRTEADQFQILSGIFNGYTTTSPLCVLISNTNQHSDDYEQAKELLRPGHADYTAYVKSKGYNDYRGGGHFSGRLTAPIVFAGAIAKQLLAAHNIKIASHIYKIGTKKDIAFKNVNLDDKLIDYLLKSDFPTIEASARKDMIDIIATAKSSGDSIGGVIEATAINLPAGIGSPFFDSLESSISHLVFSIPGVKGIEFGEGFDITEMKGSEANDQYFVSNGNITAYSNHNGGILGGITSGMPLIFRAAFKPTPSIALQQKTVNIATMKDTTINLEGRHDPCIVPRAIPVIEAITAMGILEHIL
ncbi:MAG: chorismate synthase [Lutisporaceae bacterium]